MKYHGKINFTMDKEHPDIKYVKDYAENKIFTFEDVYNFNEYYEEEHVIAYIQNDLKLVAGGGYNTDHIHNITFEINKI